MNFKTTIAAVLAATALGSPAGASAAGVGGITVRPEQRTGDAFMPVAFLNVTSKPGARRLAGRLLIRNVEPRPLTIELDAVDGLTASNLGYAYTVSGATAHRHTRWIRLSARRIVLAPGATAKIAITALPATNAKPGDYLAGISVETVGQRKAPDGKARLAISTSERYVVGVQMRIPGRRVARLGFTHAAVEAFPGGVTFLLTARNTGNVMLEDVRGQMAVYRGGRRIAEAQIGPGTFVTGTSARLQLLAAREHPHAGTKYRVRGRLHFKTGSARFDDEVVFGNRQERTRNSYVGPAAGSGGGGGLPLALAVALALAAIAGTVLAVRKHRRTRARLARLDALELQLASGPPAAA
jgi:hypothetical protein